MVMRKLESIKFSGTPAPVSLAKSAQHKRELGNLLKPLCLNPFWALLPYLLPLWNQGFYFIRDYALIKPYLWRDFFSFSWLKGAKIRNLNKNPGSESADKPFLLSCIHRRNLSPFPLVLRRDDLPCNEDSKKFRMWYYLYYNFLFSLGSFRCYISVSVLICIEMYSPSYRKQHLLPRVDPKDHLFSP